MVRKSLSDLFTDEIEYKNDKLYLILRGHLYIESELNNLLEGFIPNPSILELYKESFRRKIDLALALNLISEKLHEILYTYNDFRNKYAHRLKYNISHDEIKTLKNLISTINGMEEFSEEFIISGKQNAITDLKVIIFGIRSLINVRADSVKKCENPEFVIENN